MVTSALKCHRIFYEAYPYPPWTCYFCEEPVLRTGRGKWDGNLHHIDGDDTHNVLENLAMAHAGCHRSHHAKQQVWGPERRLANSTALTGHAVTDETRRKISQANRGGTGGFGRGDNHSEESRDKMRAKALERYRKS